MRLRGFTAQAFEFYAFTVVFAIGQTAGPYLAGALADHYGAGGTLAWTAVLCAAGAVLSTVTRSRGP